MVGTRAFTAVMVAMTLLALGCAPGLQPYEGRRRQVSPTRSSEVGVLVRGVSEDALSRLFERYPKTQFRRLNSQHGLYEIYGLSLHTVAHELPQAHVSPNEFFSRRPSHSIQRLKKLSQEWPSREFEKCVDGESPPVAQIDPLSQQANWATRVFQQHSPLELSAKGSKNIKFPNEDLRIAWVVMSPSGSLESEQFVEGQELRLKGEALGVYSFGLVVQDQRHVCGLEMLDIAVTANQELRLAQSPTAELTQLDLAPFYHLQQLKAESTWALSRGQGITIAIVDSGVNLNHPDLNSRIAINSKEIPNNGIDDDQNGFVDDWSGWDFSFQDNSAFDDVGHGSHVAGLAAGARFGMAPQARLLAVKALSAFGGDTGSVAAAIRYAVDRGAQIINVSLGSQDEPKPEMLAAIEYAEAHNVLIITAAGNGHPVTGIGLNTDEFPLYPASLPSGNILNVAATGANGQLAVYSNYGEVSVDLLAPGGDENQPLLSAFLENPSGLLFEKMSGTSMAAPLVAGVAAQVWATNTSLKASEVKSRILNAGQMDPQLKGVVQSQRRLNPLAALTASF